MERTVEYGKTILLCFVDYSKVFDCINHKLWENLRFLAAPEHLIRLIRNLHSEQEMSDISIWRNKLVRS